MSESLKPTHTCFDDALDYIERCLKADRKYAERLLLVHGICATRTGREFAHAWVEDADGYVWGGCIHKGEKMYASRLRQQFEREIAIVKCTRYTLPEVAVMNVLHLTSGPWEPEYRALCRRPGQHLEVFSVDEQVPLPGLP
jgi:flavorubredoxin